MYGFANPELLGSSFGKLVFSELSMLSVLFFGIWKGMLLEEN